MVEPAVKIVIVVLPEEEVAEEEPLPHELRGDHDEAGQHDPVAPHPGRDLRPADHGARVAGRLEDLARTVLAVLAVLALRAGLTLPRNDSTVSMAGALRHQGGFPGVTALWRPRAFMINPWRHGGARRFVGRPARREPRTVGLRHGVQPSPRTNAAEPDTESRHARPP